MWNSFSVGLCSQSFHLKTTHRLLVLIEEKLCDSDCFTTIEYSVNINLSLSQQENWEKGMEKGMKLLS